MKFELRYIFTILLIVLLATGDYVYAQQIWEDVIQNENGVVIEQKQHVDISVNDNGELEIVASIEDETQYFGENANLYSEQSIGFSNTFTEISDIVAYSLVPNGKNRFKKITVQDFVTSDSRSS
jgi:choline kinase